MADVRSALPNSDSLSRLYSAGGLFDLLAVLARRDALTMLKTRLK